MLRNKTSINSFPTMRTPAHVSIGHVAIMAKYSNGRRIVMLNEPSIESIAASSQFTTFTRPVSLKVIGSQKLNTLLTTTLATILAMRVMPKDLNLISVSTFKAIFPSNRRLSIRLRSEPRLVARLTSFKMTIASAVKIKFSNALRFMTSKTSLHEYSIAPFMQNIINTRQTNLCVV